MWFRVCVSPRCVSGRPLKEQPTGGPFLYETWADMTGRWYTLPGKKPFLFTMVTMNYTWPLCPSWNITVNGSVYLIWQRTTLGLDEPDLTHKYDRLIWITGYIFNRTFDMKRSIVDSLSWHDYIDYKLTHKFPSRWDSTLESRVIDQSTLQ